MTIHDVYGTEDNWLYSDGVKRMFGANRIVQLEDGKQILAAVQPLSNIAPDSIEKGWVKKIGIIYNGDE